MANKDNPGRGARFEVLVQRFFARRGLTLGLNYRVNVGMARERPENRPKSPAQPVLS